MSSVLRGAAKVVAGVQLEARHEVEILQDGEVVNIPEGDLPSMWS